MSDQNSFIDAMGAEKPSVSSVELDQISKYPVSPSAESTVNAIAVIMLIVGIIGGFICLIAGISQLSDAYSDMAETTGWILIAAGVVLFLVGLVQWAFLKVVVNISRNLYNINASINEKK